MAAGLGFKTFNTGDILSASDTNGYLMQGVLVFATSTARDAAITSPQEGQFAYLKDTNVTTYYTGSAWANLDTTGMVNPMTTTGDTIYSSSGSTPARLGIGTSGQVLTVSGGGVPSWATPSAGGGGKVLQVVNAQTSTAATNATDTYADSNLTASITPTSATSKILVLVSMSSISKSADANSVWKGKLLRGATSIIDFEAGNLFNNAAQINRGSASTNYLDSPATTSSTTYKVQFCRGNSSGTVGVQLDASTSTITLLEIGA